MATPSTQPGSDDIATASQAVPTVVPYERQAAENLRWAMSESSLFFEGKGKVQETLRRIGRKLSELGVPYAVAGGMALFRHGHRRYTEDVDILVTRDDLKRIHDRLDGLGYVRPFSQSKHLRDVDTGVKIEFLLAGDYPGDGKPKEVAFPSPDLVAEEVDGIKYLNLTSFITLKLASGMTGANREKDLVDVSELVKAIRIGPQLADSLPESVRAKYLEICEKVRRAAPRFVAFSKDMTPDRVSAMIRDGVEQDANGRLITSDPELAGQYDMWPEDEIFDE
jgi:hypothetical protein